MFGRAIA
ncbi:Protein of unknown function [Bacillus cereus]|nr:Protein of unknown function [Bacillus cereus]